MDRDCLKPFARAETNPKKAETNPVDLRLVKASSSNAYTNAIHFPDINIVTSDGCWPLNLGSTTTFLLG